MEPDRWREVWTAFHGALERDLPIEWSDEDRPQARARRIVAALRR